MYSKFKLIVHFKVTTENLEISANLKDVHIKHGKTEINKILEKL